MCKDKKLIIEIDTEELEKEITIYIAKNVENCIYNTLNKISSDGCDLETEIRSIFKTAINDATKKFNAEIRKEVKKEIVENVSNRIVKLDKKEIIKELIK